MEKKLLNILLNMFCDKDFEEYIETEFHLFYTVIYEAFERNENNLDNFVNDCLKNVAPYIDILYQELEKYTNTLYQELEK